MKAITLVVSLTATALAAAGCGSKERALSDVIRDNLAHVQKGAYEAGVGSREVKSAELELEVKKSKTSEMGFLLGLPASVEIGLRGSGRDEDADRVHLRMQLKPAFFDKSGKE